MITCVEDLGNRQDVKSLVKQLERQADLLMIIGWRHIRLHLQIMPVLHLQQQVFEILIAVFGSLLEFLQVGGEPLAIFASLRRS